MICRPNNFTLVVTASFAHEKVVSGSSPMAFLQRLAMSTLMSFKLSSSLQFLKGHVKWHSHISGILPIAEVQLSKAPVSSFFKDNKIVTRYSNAIHGSVRNTLRDST